MGTLFRIRGRRDGYRGIGARVMESKYDRQARGEYGGGRSRTQVRGGYGGDNQRDDECV